MYGEELNFTGPKLMEFERDLKGLADKAPAWDFVAIDFETATRSWSSACSVGIAFVRDMEVVETFHQLLRPPGNKYDQGTIDIHGIRPEDTTDAPDLLTVWEEVFPVIRGAAVVAHNARFDVSVLKASLDACSVYYPKEYLEFKYIDTVQMVRDYVPGHRKLSDCTDCLGISLENHHDAACDARACAEIAIHCIRASGCRNLGEFCFSRPHVHIGEARDISLAETPPSWGGKPKKAPAYKTVKVTDIKAQCECFNESHPFYQKSIVFTGELDMERKEAMQLAADAGALIKSAVSRKTDYLVVGKQDISLVGDDGLSSKEEKAYALNEEGKADIKIIREEEFLRLLRCEEVPV